jgi:hypothetical protein
MITGVIFLFWMTVAALWWLVMSGHGVWSWLYLMAAAAVGLSLVHALVRTDGPRSFAEAAASLRKGGDHRGGWRGWRLAVEKAWGLLSRACSESRMSMKVSRHAPRKETPPLRRHQNSR